LHLCTGQMDMSNAAGRSVTDESLTDQLQQANGPREPQPRWFSTLSEMLALAMPQIVYHSMSLVCEVTNTICLGHAGNDAELAAVGLGNMMQNCFGLSIGFGLAAAQNTLVSQAHGAGQRRLCCHYLQRCRVLVTLQLVWMIPFLWFTDTWLILLGQDAQVARYATQYNQVTAFGLFFIFQYECTSVFLCNVGKPTANGVIAGVCSLLHVAWALLFVVYLRMGNSGAGYANCVTWLLQFLLSSLYLAWSGSTLSMGKAELLWLQAPAFREWRSFLQTGIPSTLQLCSEWWFWEVCAVIVGYFGATVLAAHVSTVNLIVLTFMPIIGVNAAASTLVGNSLGANLPRKAKQAAWVCVISSIFVWTLESAVIFLVHDKIAAAYTDDLVVDSIMSQLLVIYLIAGYFDSAQNVMGACLRGMGWVRLPAAIYLLVYYGVMLPVSCVFAWPLQMGVYGVWWSMAVGTSIATVVFTFALCFANWSQTAKACEERMRLEGLEASKKEEARNFSMSLQPVPAADPI